jgi:hypothetical protein
MALARRREMGPLETPLTQAAQMDRSAIVERLLDHGAARNARAGPNPVKHGVPKSRNELICGGKSPEQDKSIVYIVNPHRTLSLD